MFAPFMMNAWICGSLAAIVCGMVGFFVVPRGESFLAHAVPNGAFAGAALAALVGSNTLLTMGVFALVGSLGSTAIRRRARSDTATALTLVILLASGSLFLSLSGKYALHVYSLMFGQILGISTQQIMPMLIIGVLCIVVVLVVRKPLLEASIMPQQRTVLGISPVWYDVVFAVMLAGAATMSVPQIGALLSFSLLTGPAAGACRLVRRPWKAMALSAGLALLDIWASLALGYLTDWPIGFFCTTFSLLIYLVAVTVDRFRLV